MPRDKNTPKPPVDKNRTLKWVAAMGTPGFREIVWYIEPTKGSLANILHSRVDCGAVTSLDVLLTTQKYHPLDMMLASYDRCATCGYGFLGAGQTNGTTGQDIGNQAKRLHEIYDCAMGANKTLAILGGVACGSDNCPALQNVLIHNMCGRMRNYISYIGADPALQHIEAHLLTMIDKLETENPLDLEQATAQVSLMAVRRLIVTPIAADLHKRQLPNRQAVHHLLSIWDSKIQRLEDAKMASKKVRNSSAYKALRKELPELTAIVRFWEKTFNEQAQRQERKIFVVTDLVSDFSLSVPVNDYDALLATGIMVRKDTSGLGDLPELVVEWLTMIGDLNLAVLGPKRNETAVSPIDFDPRLLSKEDLEVAFSLWLEAQTDTESVYVDATDAVRAATQL